MALSDREGLNVVRVIYDLSGRREEGVPPNYLPWPVYWFMESKGFLVPNETVIAGEPPRKGVAPDSAVPATWEEFIEAFVEALTVPP